MVVVHLQASKCSAKAVAENCALPDGSASPLARQLLFSVYTHPQPFHSELYLSSCDCCVRYLIQSKPAIRTKDSGS